jgi:Ca2+-transporting ATPase
MKYNFEGLDTAEVESARNKYGSNELSAPASETFIEKLTGNFKDPMIIILSVAFIVIIIMSVFHLAEWYEGAGIALAVILSVLVSTVSEYKNEGSFQKLQEEASRIKNNVFRNGKINSVFVNEIVCGDTVLLQPGNKIPADGRIIEGKLKVNQASLTGESAPVTKKKAPADYQKKNNDFSDPFRLFRGAVIEDGEAIMVVDAVGNNTVYGNLARELSVNDDRKSPLQVKLAALAGKISKFGYTGASFICVAFLFKKIVINNGFSSAKISLYFSHFPNVLHDVLTAVILAIVIIVAAVPEGLPMMIALVLSLNMGKLLNSKVLVRKLLGIETSGSLNILFSDKTGTITKGKLEARIFITGDGKDYDKFGKIPDPLRKILGFAIRENTDSLIEPSGKIFGGNISERALLEFLNKSTLLEKINTSVVNRIQFNSSRKFSAVEVSLNEKLPEINLEHLTIIKGAPEIILDNCNFYFAENGIKQKIEDKGNLSEGITKLAKRGMRTLAIVFSENSISENEELPGERVLLGIFGIRDEIREESEKSIKEAQKAGIQVVMITGDKKETAVAIAREVGLLDEEDALVFTSKELNELSDPELEALIPKIRVIARALPTDKSRLVTIAQRKGMVVGMTGDGVNDAIALKKADVGFAMGSGSEVAKEASDIVILDDNFSSITKAVLYGRTIFKSIRKFIIFQLTINVSAVLISFIAPLLNLEPPLTIVQLLWINVIMDTLAALAFGGEPALKKYMRENPVRREENVINSDMWSSVLFSGIFISIFSLLFLKSEIFKPLFPGENVFLSAFFCYFVFTTVFNGFNARTENLNLLEKIMENKGFLQVEGIIVIVQVLLTYFGGQLARTVPLNFQQWLYVILFASLIIPVDLFRKLILQSFQKSYKN